MTHLAYIIQIVSSILLIILVLLQRAEADMGGSNGDSGSFMQTRRGFERFLFYGTIATSIIFTVASLGYVILIG